LNKSRKTIFDKPKYCSICNKIKKIEGVKLCYLLDCAALRSHRNPEHELILGAAQFEAGLRVAGGVNSALEGRGEHEGDQHVRLRAIDSN